MSEYEKLSESATREESFRATVYAMNTLLLAKGVYTQAEFRRLFCEWVRKERKKGQEA